jgi:hypothetical protein
MERATPLGLTRVPGSVCVLGSAGSDRCYEIVGSPWLAELQAESGLPDLRHLELNFNAACALEVLCTAVTTVSPRRLREQGDQLASHEPLDVLEQSLAVLEHVVARDWATPPT